MEYRVCTKCGMEKLADQFYRHNNRTDRICKECRRDYGREYQRLHPEAHRKFLAKHPGYEKEWRFKNKEKIPSYSKKYYLKNLEEIREKVSINSIKYRGKYHYKKSYHTQLKIYALMARARAKGILVKLPCQFKMDNGELCAVKDTHGHHPDYSKPFEVIWLCSKHHRFIHRKYDTELTRES